MFKTSFLTLSLCLLASLNASAQSDAVFHSAKFLGDTQFVLIDGNGLRAYPFLVAEVVFVGDSLPQDGDELTIGDVTLVFRSSPVLETDIQIGISVDSTVDNARDKITDAVHVVLRTARSDNKITLVAAETVAPTLATTANGHAIIVTSFASCGTP